MAMSLWPHFLAYPVVTDAFCDGHFVYFNKVWSLEQPEWTCKIDEGSAGLIDVCWSPDSRHILTTADFHVCHNCCRVHMVLMALAN